jgi:hypothetical protein
MRVSSSVSVNDGSLSGLVAIKGEIEQGAIIEAGKVRSAGDCRFKNFLHPGNLVAVSFSVHRPVLILLSKGCCFAIR